MRIDFINQALFFKDIGKWLERTDVI